ncbi:MAG: phosphogluconate dehydratase [Paracoccaceae bacterium]|jgi:phosphogluconate dehydratase
MAVKDSIKRVTDRIIARSEVTRTAYLTRMHAAANDGPQRGHLSCSAQAHAYAGAGQDQAALAKETAGNLAIITTYNDMLSAHQPFEKFPDIIRRAARDIGATAQVAGGVPAMCDGITQGYAGMELSLFSRDVIAMAASIALSHNTFDAAVYLGVCDKIVPGLVIAAQSFGHLPAVFLPAGPMTSGLANDEKAKVRQQFATGEVDRDVLMKAEMAAYHGPGTCTFYGTANTNQMLMEIMGLHLPGASFVTPNTELRSALTTFGAQQALKNSALGENYTPICHILDERAFVNGLVGLNATGGSTNLMIHLIAMARAGGILLNWQDFSDISEATPLVARIYPNGLADVNHFHAAGGLATMIGDLLDTGLLHKDVKTTVGDDLSDYAREPKLIKGDLVWQACAKTSLNPAILRSATDPFQSTGGMKKLDGNLGSAVMKVSAVDPSHHIVKAKARVFDDQNAVKDAFKAGEFTDDLVVVVRFQGPKANGMPELHSLTPLLTILQGRGLNVALVTDGRMSGASGKVPAAIHVCPEAMDGGLIAKLQDGDLVLVDATTGTLNVLEPTIHDRPDAAPDLTKNGFGLGRELFDNFRRNVGSAETGASALYEALD